MFCCCWEITSFEFKATCGPHNPNRPKFLDVILIKYGFFCLFVFIRLNTLYSQCEVYSTPLYIILFVGNFLLFAYSDVFIFQVSLISEDIILGFVDTDSLCVRVDVPLENYKSEEPQYFIYIIYY
uniref:Uncharacterized protein n=1 Tax=Cacopsylla melanoneura TaxID=428564 RepID=A0A8D8ZGS2_9HEMI